MGFHEHVLQRGVKLGNIIINSFKSVIDGTSNNSIPTEAAVVAYHKANKYNIEQVIAQTGHGFIVGNSLRFDATTGWQKASALTPETSEVLGLVSEVIDVDNFRLSTKGFVDEVALASVVGGTGLVAGNVYYLSTTQDGKLTSERPTGDGEVVKPILYAVSTASGYLLNYLGVASNKTVFEETLDAGYVVLDTFRTDKGFSANWFYGVRSEDKSVNRSGTIYASWDSTNDLIDYTEIGNNGLGDANDIVFTVDIQEIESVGYVRLLATNVGVGTGWNVRVKREVL